MKAVKLLGYAGFFMFALVLWIYWTFPWAVAKDRALTALSQASGMEFEARVLEPNWVTGVEAKDVRIFTKPDAEPIEVAQLDARAHVLPLLTGGKGATADLPIAGGQVHVDFVQSGETTEVDAQIDDLELALVPGLKDSIGLPLSGTMKLDVDVEFNAKEVKKSKGTIKLVGKGLELLKGGKISGFPVPELEIGSLNWNIPIKDGKAKFDKQTITGDNVEVIVDGELLLNKKYDRSTLNLVLSFKPTPAFLKKEPLLGALLNNIKRAKGKDGFYNYAVAGSIKHPRFTPKRK